MKIETVIISKEEYEQLCESKRVLDALEGAGVDNWEGYEYALELLGEGEGEGEDEE